MVGHIFEGQSKSFAKILSLLIEEKFLKIVVSNYYKVLAAICCLSCSKDVALPNFDQYDLGIIVLKCFNAV